MANDKDFIVKNAVEVGKDTKVTLGSITSNVLQEGYSLGDASYDSKSFSVASQDTEPHGVYFKSDGLKMYVIGNNNDNIYQYTLSTAWDVSTASYDSKSFSTGTQDAAPRDVFLNDDGTKAYVVGGINDTIYEYDLSTAYDISTASYNSVSLSVTSQEGLPTGIFFKPDGTKFWICGQVGDEVNQYSLSTAWDLSTASFDSVTFSVATEDTSPQSLFFKSDGTKMYVTGNVGDAVYQYSLSTAWDLSTASYDSVSFDISLQDVLPTAVFFKDDGTKMYIGGDTNNTIYQYSTASYAEQINLDTGNYFNDTLTANTTYTFSNAGSVQSFQVEVTGGTVVTVNNISDATYDSKSFSVTSQDTQPAGLAFKPDGTKMYVSGIASDNINEYNLSTAWDVSTASYVQNLSVSSLENNPYDVDFKPDGTKMYVIGSTNDTVFEFDLSTAWDVSTATYNSNSFNVQAQDSSSYGIYFKPDGTKFYIAGDQYNKVYQYSLSTAWDITSASYDSVEYSVVSQSGSIRKVWLNSAGTKMYILDGTNTAIYQYTLSTAFDISTASYDSNSFSVGSQELGPNGMVFKPDATKVYIVGTQNDTVYQYTTGTALDTTITWPTSIEWSFGATPFAPANGQTDLFTISTDDGGTTYIGLHTADNLS